MIPFIDIQKINQRHEADFQSVLSAFLQKGQYILGEYLKEFELKFARYTGSKYALGVANGLDALTLILVAYRLLGKLQKGDQVLVPAHTFFATWLAVSHAELEIVPIDVDQYHFNIDYQKVTKKISKKTKAIIAVHLYGQIAPMQLLKEIAQKHQLLLIEDAAQAHGAILENQKAGSLADAAAFSFYPTKNLGALGDGGMICSDNEELIQQITSLRNYGSAQKYHYQNLGYNSRLDEIQAAFLLQKLPLLDNDNQKRQQIAHHYLTHIQNKHLQLPAPAPSPENHVWHLFVIQAQNRAHFQDYMLKNHIQTAVHYPIALQHQPPYHKFAHLALPVSQQLAAKVVSLPISPVLDDDAVNQIVETVNDYKN